MQPRRQYGYSMLFFLMGDSHAEHLLYGLNKALTKDSGMRGMYINRSCLQQIAIWALSPELHINAGMRHFIPRLLNGYRK